MNSEANLSLLVGPKEGLFQILAYVANLYKDWYSLLYMNISKEP